MAALERIYLACDVASLWHVCRVHHGLDSRINFEVLKDIVPTLRGGLEGLDVHATAYILTHRRSTHGEFSAVLRTIGYSVRESMVDYVVVDNAPKSYGDDWTVGITVDALDNLHTYDTFVLATGGGQYSELIKYLNNQGKNTIVISFESEENKALFRDADEVLFLSKDIIYK